MIARPLLLMRNMTATGKDGDMATFQAKMKYVDIRILTIEADSEEEALGKLDAGDFDEHTVDFYADDLLTPLHEVKP